MFHEPDISAELTDLVYGSLFGECGWEDFLDRLATTVPNGKAALHYHDLASPVAHVPYTSGFTKDDIDQFSHHFAAVNPWIPRMGLIPVGKGLCGEDIVARDELVKSEFYNDWLKRQAGCETSIGATIIRDQTRTFILSTSTSSTDANFNRHAAEQYTTLAPHLKRAFDFVRRSDTISGEHRVGQTLFDGIGVGLFYVSEMCRARSWNKSADRMLATGVPIRMSTDGRLSLQCDRTVNALEFLTSRHGVQTEPHVSTVRGGDGTLYRVTLVRMKSDTFTEFLNGPTVAMIIETANASVQIDRGEYLRATYNLTPREVHIVSSIVSGFSLREISVAGGVSYETVRTQMKTIYSKLGVNSQSALVALIMRRLQEHR
ncbi:DNA-binding CsgD family transcriptional regulator [Pararhizobium capsulatum DSM 1112]|uniref:DNA-binding CsgD family transcriptional regulator n=1 Tax=Pararhizobium capsulatum DSM 1112 TaxID=1121113 RepID=A0ABU0BZ11_9HYPH|nr:helix-turn-helix transcriptional regulator [Pararhizobium capsulatum]MDQ0323485.1 DNA-binding CsgD family transcriptional regulator [Pararhizobium capsulatum DSM 1112]